MQEKPQNSAFNPESIDEQIEQLAQERREDAPISRLVNDLHMAYSAEEQVSERIRKRLLNYAAGKAQTQRQPIKLDQSPYQRREPQMKIREVSSRKHIWTHQLLLVGAVLVSTLVVVSLIVILQMARSKNNSGGTAAPAKPQQVVPTKTVQQTDSGIYLGVNDQLVKVDAQTRKVVWRFTVQTDPQAIPALRQIHIGRAPIIANHSVYFTALNGKLYALDVQTGKQRWVHDFQMQFQPYVADGAIYVSISESGAIYSLNPLDGTIQKTYKVFGSIAGIFNGVMYINSTNTLTALNVSDGNQLWQAKVATSQNLNGEVIVKNGLLYASSIYINVQKSANEPQASLVYTIALQDGKVTWQSPAINGFILHLAVDDNGHVYFGAQNHYVYGFDPKTNQQLWQYHTIAGHVYAAPLVLDGTVYVGQSSAGENGPGNDHLVALDAASGKPRWEKSLQGYTGIGDNEAMGLYNGVIYLGTGNGVQGFSAATGDSVVQIPARTLLRPDAPQNAYLMGLIFTIVP